MAIQKKIGVLSLQGDFREHIEMLKKCGAETIEVRLPQDMEEISGLIIPGGESTTIGNLMEKYEIGKEIIKKNKQGMAIYGTCAGAILLAKDIIGSIQPRLGILDISVKRNNYGRQIESFEAGLDINEIGKFKGIFIRAPVIERICEGVKILSSFEGKPVLVKKGTVLAGTFHPELTDDSSVHEYFVGMVKM